MTNPRPLIYQPTALCPACNQEFIQTRPDKRFCSKTCQHETWKSQNRPRMLQRMREYSYMVRNGLIPPKPQKESVPEPLHYATGDPALDNLVW